MKAQRRLLIIFGVASICLIIISFIVNGFLEFGSALVTLSLVNVMAILRIIFPGKKIKRLSYYYLIFCAVFGFVGVAGIVVIQNNLEFFNVTSTINILFGIMVGTYAIFIDLSIGNAKNIKFEPATPQTQQIQEMSGAPQNTSA